jgi:hypothetical protein
MAETGHPVPSHGRCRISRTGAKAKTKHPWRIAGGTVTGGLIKWVSPAKIHVYFER